MLWSETNGVQMPPALSPRGRPRPRRSLFFEFVFPKIEGYAYALCLLLVVPSMGVAQVQTEVPPVVVGARPVTVERIRIHGAWLEGNLENNEVDRDVLVFLPPSYQHDKARRYAVVYALHGYSIGAAQWSQEIHVPQTIEGAFAQGAHELIVVLPDSKTLHNGSMYSSSVTTGDFERFIAHDVVRYIDTHYRTIAQRGSRGLVGHSMGGYGATRIGMKHADVFGAVYIMSPCCLSARPARPSPQLDSALQAVRTREDAVKLPWGARAQLATAAAWSPNPNNPPLYLDLPIKDGVVQNDVVARWAANAPLALIDQYVGNLRRYRGIAIDVGDQDGLRADAARLHEALDRYGISNRFEVYPGTHTSAMAVRFQNYVLPFFSEQLCVQTPCDQPPAQPAYLNPALPIEQRVRDLISRMTLEEKASQLRDRAAAIPRLDVPAYYWWNEAAHGVAAAGIATNFPQTIGMAATWNSGLVHEIGSVISTEARAKYHDSMRRHQPEWFFGLTFWAPNINIFRDPRWGRGMETYGEDPFLAGRLAVAFVTGMQGDDPKHLKVVATPKHFAVHSGPEPLRHRFNVDVAPHDLEDTYLPAFRAAVVEGNARSVMCAYNAVDGVPACASRMLLQDHLRRDWGFDGYIVSDCAALNDVATGHKYAPDLPHAAGVSLKAGTDLECGFGNDMAYLHLVDAVKQGLITEALMDTALTRLFTARFRLGYVITPNYSTWADTGYHLV